MATNYYFRAVASDGKLRTGVVHGETEKLVAQRTAPAGAHAGLRRRRREEVVRAQAAVVRGAAAGATSCSSRRSSRRCSTPACPLDRALSITSELTERPVFRVVVQDVMRVLKGGKSLADSLATQARLFLRAVHQHGARGRSVGIAGGGLRAAGGIRAHARRSAELHHLVDGLSGAAGVVGTISVIFLLTFVVPRFAQVFQDSHMKIPLPTKIMLESSTVVKTYGWMAAAG